MFDCEITQFSKRVADLADQPALSADALKQWFDSSPEELRLALNQICDDGQTLAAKVEAIILGTFEGTIEKSMFSNTLKAELNDKVTTESLNASLATINSKLEALDDADDATMDAVNDLIVVGTYQGNGETSQFVNLGFTPRALLTTRSDGRISQGNYIYGGFVLPGMASSTVSITDNGFTAQGTSGDSVGNSHIYTYKYLALR